MNDRLLPHAAALPAGSLLAVIDVIKEIAAAEKIFLLGYTTSVNTSTNIFMPQAISCQQPFACTLLVLVHKSLGKKPCHLEHCIEKRCSPFLPVTVLIQTLETFIEKNRAGDFFTGVVLDQAVLLYSAGSNKSETINCFINPVKAKQAAEHYFHSSLGRAKEFLAGTQMYLARHQYTMAAFMLHQAAELGLVALFKTITGFRIQTHSIERLLRYCYGFSAELGSVFPAHTEQGKKLLAVLQQAYLDARYMDNYTVGRADIEQLTDRVHALHQVIETTTYEWLEKITVSENQAHTVA